MTELPDCLGTEAFLGSGTFSAKTGTVLGKPTWLVTPRDITNIEAGEGEEVRKEGRKARREDLRSHDHSTQLYILWLFFLSQ